MTALEIAAALRRGEVSAAGVVRSALDDIERGNARLNAFTAVFAERALRRAAHVDAEIAAGRDPGPLAGVPFAAKNLFDVAGIVTRAGAVVTAGDAPARADADAVRALENAGAILVGATNMDEFAYGFVTENAHDGATHNPHDRARIAGGSSGGSASAVAGGLVPLALGSDTNGSIRVPSALCGLFGIRPTQGRISRRGAYPLTNSTDTVGPFARTAGDLTAAFAALAGPPDGGARVTGSLRVARLGGYFERALLPEAAAATDRICSALHANEIVEVPEAARARAAAFLLTAAEAGALHAARLRTNAFDYDPATRDRLIGGALMPAPWYLRAQRFRSWYFERFVALFERFDVLVAPATPYPATRIGEKTIVIDGVEMEVRPNLGAFTQPITLAGVPVVAVPVVEPGSLPLGVQLIGRPGSDELLLQVARELERAGAAAAGPVPVAA